MPHQAGKRHAWAFKCRRHERLFRGSTRRKQFNLFDGDVMSFQIQIKPTERGFMRGEFKDGDGNDCVIQDSSLATDYMVRLGQLEGTHHRGYCLATMHLTKEMARTLIQALMRFVNNGTIAEIDQIDKEAFAETFSQYMASSSALINADGRKLLWLFKNMPDIDLPAGFSPAAAVINAIEDRLYPEYDGDKVTMTEHGWSTPEGEINYL